jgi:hypothetical protein
MCRGISILKSRIRRELIERYALESLAHRRSESAEEELWFDYADRTVKQVLLPVQQDGQLVIQEWGNRAGTSKLPKTGWCRLESLEAGKWQSLHPADVLVPANLGLEKGVWFQVVEGMKGVTVLDESGASHVYMLTQAASHYYQVMTRHDRMPVLIGEQM